MSRKIIGITVGTQLPKPNFDQTDPSKGDYIKGDRSFLNMDDTLTQSGRPADAKATGEAIQSLQANIDQVSDLVGDTAVSEQIASAVSTNYNESIIGLSVDGTVVTYIKGDGSKHTFETQDTNTTYSLGTDEATGLTKLYATTGSAEDGTMTQKAIKTELDKKVGVSVDEAQGTLIFTI